MAYNITNLTGADTLSAFGQALAPIQTNVLGMQLGGVSWLLGMVILIFVGGVLLVFGLSFEAILFLISILAYELAVIGFLPPIIEIAVMLVWALIIVFAFYKFILRR